MPAFDNVLSSYLDVKYATPIRRYICPVCAYKLDDTDRGLHCVACGWHESGGAYPKYVPRVPDNPSS